MTQPPARGRERGVGSGKRGDRGLGMAAANQGWGKKNINNSLYSAPEVIVSIISPIIDYDVLSLIVV